MMKTEKFEFLARRLIENPHLLNEAEDEAVRELLANHSAGILDSAAAETAEKLIRSDDHAAAIWAEFQKTDKYLESQAGKEWLESATASLKACVGDDIRASTGKFTADIRQKLLKLSQVLTQGFRSLPLAASASDNQGGEQVIWEHRHDVASMKITKDRFGFFFLSITTTDEALAQTRVEVQRVKPNPILIFRKLRPGFYSGEIEVSSEFVMQIASGEAIIELTSAETSGS